MDGATPGKRTAASFRGTRKVLQEAGGQFIGLARTAEARICLSCGSCEGMEDTECYAFSPSGNHTGQFALSGRFEHGSPQPRTDVELAAFFGDEVQRDMDVAVHDLGNDHFGPARHGGMDGVLTEETAIDPVVGVGRDGTDDVAWVDVFDADGHFPVEIVDDGRPQQAPHVGQHGIPGGVAGFVLLEEVLACAFSRDDDGVPAPV